MGGGVLGSIPEPRGQSKRESCLRAPHQTDWTDPMECECPPEDSVDVGTAKLCLRCGDSWRKPELERKYVE